MSKEYTSVDSIANANRERGQFSGHDGALGAAGYHELNLNPDNCTLLGKSGDNICISPGPKGFDKIMIGGAWDRARLPENNPLLRLFRRTKKVKIDLDLGCLYELQDGTRGAIQAFGEKFGSYRQAPYIWHTGDERTGDRPGFDETIHVNGAYWQTIKRVLVYMYIYSGAPTWASINPKVMVDVPGEQDLVMTLSAHHDYLPLCAIGSVENLRGGIKLTNFSEYFPGHEEMDRAFGFGLNWEDGKKR